MKRNISLQKTGLAVTVPWKAPGKTALFSFQGTEYNWSPRLNKTKMLYRSKVCVVRYQHGLVGGSESFYPISALDFPPQLIKTEEQRV